jgi:hypothetical protein
METNHMGILEERIQAEEKASAKAQDRQSAGFCGAYLSGD